MGIGFGIGLVGAAIWGTYAQNSHKEWEKVNRVSTPARAALAPFPPAPRARARAHGLRH